MEVTAQWTKSGGEVKKIHSPVLATANVQHIIQILCTLDLQNSNAKIAAAILEHLFCNFIHFQEELRISNSCHLLVHCAQCVNSHHCLSWC